MKCLSIFVDESGDFGDYNKITEYYILSFVFHEQSNDISGLLERLDQSLLKLYPIKNAVHTAPLIRKEKEYSDMNANERREILRKLFYFAKATPITHKTFVFSKRNYNTFHKLYEQITREVYRFLYENKSYFDGFDKIIIYYDNGQQTISSLIRTLAAINFNNYEIRKVLPVNYRLFQVADMLCTFYLIDEKAKDHGLSNSEKLVLHSLSDFKKDFLKDMQKKEFKE